jgi:tRNA nucleotidyltransferase/poly(A) polymerase
MTSPLSEDGLIGFLDALRRLAKERALYVVGGAVRDLLMGRPLKDLDLAVSGSPRALGREIARQFDGAFFYLREADETARIVFKSGAGEIRQIDLVAMKGETIQADLLARDFTVNALALDVKRIPNSLDAEGLRPAILDATGGLADLEAGIVRRCSPRSLPDDPLRTMRAVRVAANFGWRIEPETRRQILDLAPELRRISTERIRDELFLMLGLSPVSRAKRALRLLDALHLLEIALRGPAHPNAADRWAAMSRFLSPSSLRGDDPLLLALCRELESEITPPRSRLALLRLAALLDAESVLAKPGARRKEPESGLASRLALSAAEAKAVRLMLEAAREAGTSEDAPDEPLRLHRFFRRYGDATPGGLLLAAADRRLEGDAAEAKPFEDRVRRWLRAWFFERERYLPAPMLDGGDLMEFFQAPGGPWLAKLLEALREAQVVGDVQDRESAVRWATERREECS